MSFIRLAGEQEQEIADLIQQMTMEEKVSQMLHGSAAIDRLGIPRYNWWNEALHGIARAGVATVFPQAIALAATFDPDLAESVASSIADEARAKYEQAVSRGVREQYHGLTFWTPNINIFRDPRWGRGQETYGEDPVLTTRMGQAFVRGLQGDDPRYLKTAACAKHFAVHSGPEALRHSFDARVSLKDLHETYLPAFKALVEEGVESVMGAYNRTLGEACCASSFLMEEILRGEWGFEGHYVSDCWAIKDLHENHGLTRNAEESAALAVQRGCDLNCGNAYEVLCNAVRNGLLDESYLDLSVSRLLRTRYKLGILGTDDPSNPNPYKGTDPEVVRSPEHLDLALRAARKSIVLLKNSGDLLPLDDSPKRILLIGPAAANLHVLLGNYHGLSPDLISILEGMSGALSERPGISMDYHPGIGMYGPNKNTGWTVGMAEKADVVIAVFGIDSAIEGEEGDAVASDCKGDRDRIELPPWQLEYLQALRDRGKPLVLILTGGSPIAVPDNIADAILFAWYPGEQGGRAVADIVFGETNPSGKLPLTFPVSTEDLPPYEDYSMAGRTYRYMEKRPLFPFGFGLSYSRFAPENRKISGTDIRAGENIKIQVDIANKGSREGEEVCQVYLRHSGEGRKGPDWSLRAFKRLSIAAGASGRVEFVLKPEDFETVGDDGIRRLVPGVCQVLISNCSPRFIKDFPETWSTGIVEINIEESK
ncbi:MAG: glycoside hydrolase family 3 C-terminal domain-containing protein [Spirochaetales bacterium]|nr:glycoside hydrolase family 3 C-terminal domain-containing protein [Spirochaetales bacterium]